MRNLLFISEMKDMKADASSTQIMTYNLLYGLKEAGYCVTFLAVCNDACDTESVVADFSPIVADVQCVPSAMNLLSRKRSILSKYTVQLRYALFNRWYRQRADRLRLQETYDAILTHLPAIESAYYARALRKRFPKARYLQYWSDPYARSGLSAREKLPAKRCVMRFMEKRILKEADSIVYGTPLLRETQAREYPQLARRMRFCHVSYNVYTGDTDRTPVFSDGRRLIGYVGGYRSTYRNIDPLYAAMRDHPELGNLVLCGFSDVSREEKDNIRIIQRCSPQRAVGVEEQLDIHVCLLNMTMSQIPGKIFYQANSGKPILVILDGPGKEVIRTYLESFDRFEFAENTEEDICRALDQIVHGRYTASLTSPESLTPVSFARSILQAGELA